LIPEKANRILLLKLRKEVILPLNEIVGWDRYSIRDNGGFIFGWIKRDDGFYDFVVVNFQLYIDTLIVGYNTSSKKYSKEIGERLSKGANLDYIECIPASDFPEAQLVSWQKKAAGQTTQ
jgi:hypothetical protein